MRSPRTPNAVDARMVQLPVRLEPEQYARLRALSERTRVPVAVYIREGIDLVVNRGILPEREKQ